MKDTKTEIPTVKPSIGRIVHYVSHGTPGGVYGPEHRAAVITELNEDPDGDISAIALCVMNPTGLHFPRHIEYSSANLPGSWHWPERE